MKTSDTRAFVNQFVVGLLVTIGFGGTVGLGTVWMRHQVSVVADNNRVIEQQIDAVSRQIADTSARIEGAMNADTLLAENDSMHLGLVPMTQPQVNPVTQDTIALLVAESNRRVFEPEHGPASSLKIQLNLNPTPAVDAAVPAPAPITVPTVPIAAATAPRPQPPETDRAANFQLAFRE